MLLNQLFVYTIEFFMDYVVCKKNSMVYVFAVDYCNHHYHNCRHCHMMLITTTFTTTNIMLLLLLLLLLLVLLLVLKCITLLALGAAKVVARKT